MMYEDKMIVERPRISNSPLFRTNTTSKFLVLTAVAVLMIAATMVLAMSDADAAANIRDNRCGDNSQCAQQNSTDNGGNYVGGDLDNSR
jgi:hypothetical protein